MPDSPELPQEAARPEKPEDYEDSHYHDDDELVPADDGPHPVPQPPLRARFRRPPPRRRYPDD